MRTRNRLHSFSFVISFFLFGVFVQFPSAALGYHDHDTTHIHQLLHEARANKESFLLAIRDVDSAMILAKKMSDKRFLADVYTEKGDILKYNNYLVEADSAYKKAHKLWSDYPKDLHYLQLLRSLSITNYYLGQNRNVLQYTLEGLEAAKILKNQMFEGMFNNLSGIAMDNLGDQSKALEYYLNALKIFEILNNDSKIASVETNIGNIYQGKGALVKAEKHYLNAYHKAMFVRDSNLLSAAYNNLGIVYSDQKKYAKAKSFMLNGWRLSQSKQDSYAMSNSLINLGKLYFDLNQDDSAFYYYNGALKLSERIHDNRMRYFALSNLAEFFQKKKQVRKAIEYANQALEIATDGGTINDQLYVMKLLNELYAAAGEYKKVHNLMEKYMALNDSLYSKEMASQLMIIETQNQVRGKSHELLLEHEATKKREAYFIIAILALLLTIGLLIVLFERKRAQDAEQKRQKIYLDALLEESEGYVSVMDEHARNTYVSPSYLRTFGRVGEKRVGKSAFEFVHPDDRGLLKQIEAELNAGRLTRKNVLFRLKNNAGEYRTVRGTIKKIKEHSFINGFIINFWDVTEIQKSEQALKESEEKYRNIFNAFPDIYFMLDSEGIITEISPSVTKITGFLQREVIGQQVNKFMNPSFDVDKARDMFVHWHKITDLNIDVVGKDGRKIHCSLNAHLIHNDDGKRPAIEGILRDITSRVVAERELKKSEKELKEANQSKDKLLSLISHDVRGAIGTQKAILSMVSEDVESFTNDEISSLINTIKKSVDNTYTLVENLLSWARIMRDNIKPHIQEHKIYPVISEAFDILKERAEAKNIALLFEGDNDAAGKFDVNLMDAIIRNLLTNAIKFSDPGDEVKIKVEEDQKQLNISVKDNGIGLTKQEIKKVLSSKGNINSKLGTKNEKGTGLGLIIVREFVAMNKGSMNILSEPDQGTEFIITVKKK